MGDDINMAQSLAPSSTITVIMAVYNTERYLAEAIQSILSQSFVDFELVVVDDGSTDGSPEVLKTLAEQDPRIKVVTQVNAGIGAATQKGILESSGNYIAIMDSDDISLPNRLALQKQFLDENPLIDAVGCQWRMLNADGQKMGIDMHSTNPEVVETLMFAYFSLHHPTTMIRRTALDRVGGYSTDRSCLVPDYDVFMRLQLAGCKLANLDQLLFLWRLNPSSVTHSKSIDQTKSVIHVRDSGFSTLLAIDPEKAHSIAKIILNNFPTGTWQDDKIKHLLPNNTESLLYRTWELLIPQSPEEVLNRALILWLRSPQDHYESIQAELNKINLPWLLSLVDAYHGFKRIKLKYKLELSDTSAINSPFLSLFIPYSSDENDFLERLGQAAALQTASSLAIELVVFSEIEINFKSTVFLPDWLDKSNVIVLELTGWKTALHSAHGRYFSYLEQNFRFVNSQFLHHFEKITDSTSLVYLLAKHYFLEVVDDNRYPLQDDNQHQTWTLLTLIDKNRIKLSGFIHKRELLNEFDSNIDECGNRASHTLARFLAIKNKFEIIPNALEYFIPKINLDEKPLSIFTEKMINWYYAYGMTGLPSTEALSSLKQSEIENYATDLSKSWERKNLLFYATNTPVLNRFYLEKIKLRMRYPIFRELLVNNKKYIILELWKNNSYFDLSISIIYCLLSIIRNRFLKKLTT